MRDMKQGLVIVAALASTWLAACGADDATLLDAEEGFGISRHAVVGGQAVTAAENADPDSPYGSVIRFTNGSPSPNFSICSGTKIGARRYITAAHCVENWNGSSGARVRITNALDAEVPDGTFLGTQYTVTQVHVHPTWLAKDGTGNYLRRPLDIAMFDVSETNVIPALVDGGAPAINPEVVDDGWISQLVGYGAAGAIKKYGDNVAVQPVGTHPFFDEEAMWYTHILWSETPGGEPGDSGAPVVNSLATWMISGIVSGPGASSSQSSFSRAQSALLWINNPAALTVANGLGGYLINADAPYCLGGTGSFGTHFWACHNAYFSGASQFWKLETSTTAGYFRIRNGKFDKCLTTASSANQALALQATCDTSDRQKWQFVFKGALDQASGNTAPGYSFYSIKNRESGRCLGASSAAADNLGDSVRQWDCVAIPANPAGHWQAWVFSR